MKKDSNISSIVWSIVAAIGSKSCCILPLVLSIFGSSLSSYSPAIILIALPWISFPSLAFAHYKTWSGRNTCFTENWQRYLNFGILGVSTLLFLYVFITMYIPLMNAVIHGKTVIESQVKCPFCK